MNTKQHTRETMKISLLIVVLVGFLLAIAAWARASETGDSTQTDVSTQQETPDAGAVEQAPDTAYQQRQAARQARRKAFLERIRMAKQSAAQQRPVPAAVVPPAAALTGIHVSFKMDPRLLGGTYGGERWVSPPTYFGAGAQDTVEARVEGIDATGRPVAISPMWTPADPEMVKVSPKEGNAVKIIVKRTGETTLEVASHGVSKKLAVKAENKGTGMQVQLSQNP